jgi:hypothetical protein
MGLAAPQDPKEGPSDRVIVGRVLDDPHGQLVAAHEMLARLKAQNLEGRQKALLERAIELYKKAVATYGDKDEAKSKLAGPQARAALELARTVDRLSRLGQGDRPDPDLPPPPPPRSMVTVEGRASTKGLEVPPEITILEEEIKPGEVKGTARITIRSGDGKEETRSIVVGQGEGKDEGGIHLDPHTFVFPKAIGGSIRFRKADGAPIEIVSPEIDVKVDAEKVARLQKELAEKAKRLATEAKDHAEQARRYTLQLQVPQARAGAALKAAYEAIQKSRDTLKDNPEAKLYLDSAKELYNAARKEAEAGRLDRAGELAQAALTLTKVPGYLSAKPGADEPARNESDRPPVRREVRISREQRTETRDGKPRIEVKVEAREGEPEAKDEAKPRDEPKPEKDDAAPKADASSPPIGGVGVQFAFEDGGKLRVLRILPESPADKEGSIKVGATLVGVEKDGRPILFEKLDQPEIVSHLRGNPGTVVNILVLDKDQDSKNAKPHVVTLKRAEIAPDDITPGDEAPEAVRRALRSLPEPIREQLKLSKPSSTEIPPELP